MTAAQALIAFSVAAGLLTITPGLDTALVLRTAAVEGPRRAGLAALGVCLGTIVWGAAVGFGLGALFAASHLAYEALKWAGAAYLVWLGANLVLKPRDRFEAGGAVAHRSGPAWFWRGLFNNLLNPKAGVFYVSFLPQFVPGHVAVAPWCVMLASLHALMGVAWFGAIIGATRPIAAALRRAAVVRWLDRLTGGLFIGFGLRLALDRR
jgi:threonine/homoserine/homoserine lactone efflux protein